MRLAWLHLLAVCCVVVFAGCGAKRMNIKGRITKGGSAFVVPEDDFVRVTFVPVMPGGENPSNCYIAAYNNKDGTFKALGADLTGIPPGKYRITVAHERNRKDLLKGAFDIDKTPFSFDIRSPSEEIVLALDKAKPRPEESRAARRFGLPRSMARMVSAAGVSNLQRLVRWVARAKGGDTVRSIAGLEPMTSLFTNRRRVGWTGPLYARSWARAGQEGSPTFASRAGAATRTEK
jgi:hypothetical protein